MLRTRRWLPSRSLARRSRGPLLGGLWLRVRTRFGSRELDRELASGTDPLLSDALSLRAGQLGSVTTRFRLAGSLWRAVELASGRYAPLTLTRLRTAAIGENRELLMALSARLRGGEPLGVQGLALTARLVGNRSGPLYRGGPGAALHGSILQALDALEHGHRTVAVKLP